MRTFRRSALVILAAVALASVSSCAVPKKAWYKPGMTQDKWAVDSATCRSRAQHLAEDAYAAEPPAAIGGIDNTAGYTALMRKHGAGKNMETLYRRCLERLGYRLIEPKPKADSNA